MLSCICNLSLGDLGDLVHQQFCMVGSGGPIITTKKKEFLIYDHVGFQTFFILIIGNSAINNQGNSYC